MMSRSLKQVGRMGEGYLSDVPASASNSLYNNDTHSEISEDPTDHAKHLEKQFKEKYQILRETYEQRIKQLSATLEQTCSEVVTDEIVVGMKSDPTSSVFIPSIIQEIVQTHLQGSREKYILSLLENDTAHKRELNRRQEVMHSQQHTIQSLQSEIIRLKKAEDAVVSMKNQLQSIEHEYKAVTSQTQEELRAVTKQKEKIEARESSMREQLDRVTAELSAKKIELDRVRGEMSKKTREVYELEKSVELSSKDIEHMENIDSRLRSDVDTLSRKLQSVSEHRDSLVSDVKHLTDKIQHMTMDLDRCKSAEESMRQENIRCKQSVSEVMAKVEKLLEEESAEGEAALETARRKLQSLQEKYDIDIGHEKNISQKLREEVNTCKASIEEKIKENRGLTSEVSTLRDQISIGHEKLLSMRLQVEEASAEAVRCKSQASEWQTKARQAEVSMNDLIASHNREKRLIEEQVRLEMEKQIDSDNRQIEQRAGVYRLHYQNQADVAQSRIRSGALPEVMDVSRSDSFVRRDVAQHDALLSQIDELKAINSHQEKHYTDQIFILKKKFEQADETIERLKKMVHSSHDAANHYKMIISRLKEQQENSTHMKSINVLSNDQSSDACVDMVRTKKLEAEIVRLQNALSKCQATRSELKGEVGEMRNSDSSNAAVEELKKENERLGIALSRCQAQAMQDQEEDSRLLEEMKKKFDTLMDKYEQSCNDRDEEIRKQKEVIQGHENTINEQQEEIQQMLKETMSEVDRMKVTLSRKESQCEEVEQTREQLMNEVLTLSKSQDELHKAIESAQNDIQRKDELCREQVTIIESQKLAITSLESALEQQKGSTEKILQDLNTAREEDNQIKSKYLAVVDKLNAIDDSYRCVVRDLRVTLEKVRDSVNVQKSSMQSEIDSIVNKIEAHMRPLWDNMSREHDKRLQMLRKTLTAAHLEEEKNLLRSLSKQNQRSVQSYDDMSTYSNDSKSVSGGSINRGDIAHICDGYMAILKAVFESLTSCDVLSETTGNDILYLIATVSTQLKSGDIVERDSMGVLSARIYDMIVRGAGKFTEERDKIQGKIEQMSDDLRKERIRRVEYDKELSELRSRYNVLKDSTQNTVDNMSGTLQRSSLPGGKTSEYEREVQSLRLQIEDMKSRHKIEIDRLRGENEKRESALKNKLNLMTRDFGERQDVVTRELESKLRTEQSRRQHLQTRLLAEESAHRKELEQQEKRYAEVQKRAERAELEWSKLKIEFSHK